MMSKKIGLSWYIARLIEWMKKDWKFNIMLERYKITYDCHDYEGMLLTGLEIDLTILAKVFSKLKQTGKSTQTYIEFEGGIHADYGTVYLQRGKTRTYAKSIDEVLSHIK